MHARNIEYNFDSPGANSSRQKLNETYIEADIKIVDEKKKSETYLADMKKWRLYILTVSKG